MKVKDVALLGILNAILYLVDQVLSFVPFLQLSMLLIILFSRKMGTLKTSIIVIIYVLFVISHLMNFLALYNARKETKELVKNTFNNKKK